MRAAALGHTEGNIIVVNNDINSVQDLKGKSFAIPHKQSTQKILVDLMLERAGLSEKDVQIVEMSPPEMPSALSVGQIAGYSVAEPFGSLAIEMGAGKVFEDLITYGMTISAAPSCSTVNLSMNTTTWRRLSQKPISMQVHI